VRGLAGPERARQLVVPVRLRLTAELLEAAAERVVRVVVHGRELEHLAELGLRLRVALDAEVGDPERLTDRGLLRLAPLGLLERNGGLRRTPLLEVRPALLKEVEGLAHRALSEADLPALSTT